MDQHPPPGPRRHIVDPGPGRPKPSATNAPQHVDRVAALIHDLNNMLDGSLRCIASAQRALDPGSTDPDAIDHARTRVELVRASLERMLEMLHAAMRSVHNKMGTSSLMPMHPITLGETIAHAAEVLRPEAFELGITIQTSVDPAVANSPAGPIYTVLLNGIKNAIESIERCPGRKGGAIELAATLASQSNATNTEANAIQITITDDGVGLQSHEAAIAFEPGVTAKPHGLGLGLSIAREVIRSIEGRVSLVAHAPHAGATLTIIFPIQPHNREDSSEANSERRP